MMNISLLQEKIDTLQHTAFTLLHIADEGHVYVDELALLNKKVHEQINALYSLQGLTVEQEANLCLALLMGYSVSMYANVEDEIKKQTVLKRSRKVLDSLSSSQLKSQLATYLHACC